MAIGRTFEETIQKAIRSVDHLLHGFQKVRLCSNFSFILCFLDEFNNLFFFFFFFFLLFLISQNSCGLSDEELMSPTDQRLFIIANALHEGYSVQKLWELTKIDKWFLSRLKHIVDLEKEMKFAFFSSFRIPPLFFFFFG